MHLQNVITIGLAGFGTVGGGIVELLKNNPNFRFKRVCVRDVNKKRDVVLPKDCQISSNINDILDDPEIQLVIEVMGGLTLAKDLVFGAIQKGKHVVSANKAMISKYMDELMALHKQHPNVHFMYEAAVCGGIPIINVLKRSLVCDSIQKIVGIMNGTSNFMLTKMEKEGLPYESVLQDAQNRGYAEADPSADVEGWDARSKLCILTKLAFGQTTDEQKVYCQGISRISTVDFQYAKMLKRTIKLLAFSQRVTKPDGTTVVTIAVSPSLVPLSNPIAGVCDVTNVVELHSKNLDRTWYIGPGAGRYPTANSIVADVVDLHEKTNGCSVKGTAPPPFPSTTLTSTHESDFEADFYIRFVVDDKVGVIHKISGVMAELGVSIFSILQTPIENPMAVPFAVITEKCKLSAVRQLVKRLKDERSQGYTFLKEDPFLMPYMA